jgi:stress-induced morphogen
LGVELQPRHRYAGLTHIVGVGQVKVRTKELAVAGGAGQHIIRAGHAGARQGGESHFRALVVSTRFEGRGRVERQRMVYAALGDLMGGAIHALAMRTLTPEAWSRTEASS